MIRCGYRAYGSGLLVEDTSFNTYTTNAIKNNIDVGVYFYSQALNKEEAIEEANYVLTLVKPYNITYPIAIDVEAIENDSFRQENLSASELTDVIIAFCDTIKAAGYTPLIYSNLLYFMDNVELERLEGYDKWFAGYQTASPYYPYKYAMWQYTSTGSINGVSGNVDINIAMKNLKK
jgi:GH25 family lysozyme M1 (1,4-beta-N-acetylmuramidase)